MTEALMLFESLLPSTWFNDSAITLLFTKSNLFRIKVAEKPINRYFPEYVGPDRNVEEGKEFFVEKFMSLNKSEGRRIDVFCEDVTDLERFAPVMDHILSQKD